MNVCEEISQSLKQNILILEKSAVKINTKGSDSQKYTHEVDTFMLKKEDQSSRKNILIPNEINFGLSNPYFKLSWKPDDSNINSHLDIPRKSQKLYKGNYSSCKGEEIKQALPFSITKNQSDFSAEILPNGVENGTNSYKENAKIWAKNHQGVIQLMKSVDKNNASKKRKHEDGIFDSSMLKECGADRKKILLKTEKECCMGNPYLEFILKSEDCNPDLCFNGNSEGHDAKNLDRGPSTSCEEENTGKNDNSCINNCEDIFGNNFTAKDRNKFKVNCPHCRKIVPAPGFVRHLTYCMGVGIRKRTRRS